MPTGVEASVTNQLDTEGYASDTDTRYTPYPPGQLALEPLAQPQNATTDEDDQPPSNPHP